MAARSHSNIPRISQAEWNVMQVIWDEHPITANEVVGRLAGRHDWSPRTVKTMLNRLVQKGALRFRTQGKCYLYYPAVRREACTHAESQSFLERVFGGAAGPMLVHFVENAPLSDEEIDALRRALDEKREN